MYDREEEKRKKINERGILIGESAEILPFGSSNESNQAEDKIHKLMQDYTHITSYYA